MNKLRLLSCFFFAADDHSGGAEAPIVPPADAPAVESAPASTAEPTAPASLVEPAAAANADPETPAEPAPEPAKEEAPRTLKAAVGLLGETRATVADLTGQVSSLRRERDALRGQFDAAVAEASAFKSELATLRTELDVAVSARTAAEERAGRSDENSARLEKLCSVRGVDPNAAVASTGEDPCGSETAEDLLKQFASIKDPSARASFWKANEAAMLA